MSLHALAGHMAAKGRGSDSMLVHMTPEEVQSLQVLALRAGGTLTINPETGLPEANFLKKMLPMIAGFALGPAGYGLSAGMAGLAVGGVSALATGSLSRGLMAGLGAYGGAGLGAGLASAGEASLAASGVPVAENVAGAAIPPIEQINPSNFGISAADKLSAGANAVFTDPKSVVTALGGPAKAIGTTFAAVSPMMAADTVQTTTPRQDTGYIRQKKFNPYTQQYIDLEPVKASEWGSRRFSDYAGGGIVALAAGGVSDEAVANWFATNPGASDTAIASAMRQFSVSPEQVARVTGVGQPEVQQRYEAAIAPQIVSGYSEGVAGPGATTAQRGSGYLGIYDELQKAGVSPTELANAPGYQGWSQPAIERAYDVAGAINVFDPRTDSATLSDKDWAAFMDQNKFTSKDIAQATGLSEAEVQRRYDTAKAVPKFIPPITTSVAYAPPSMPNPGDIIASPDGSRTVVPNIPGRPTGGFTGMDQVKDAYTAGGGSLGYIPYAPKTAQEFTDRYAVTGGSKQAYDYLMNKGAADIRRPITKTGELMLPYSEAVLGQVAATTSGPATQKYLFDRRTRRYIPNPAYVDPNAPKTTAAPATEDSTVGGANGGMMRMALGGVAVAGGGTARDGLQQINSGTNTVSQAIDTATSALGGVGGGGSRGYQNLLDVLRPGEAPPFNGQNNGAAGFFGMPVSVGGMPAGLDDSGMGAANATSAGPYRQGPYRQMVNYANSGNPMGGKGSAASFAEIAKQFGFGGRFANGGQVRRMALGGLGALAAGGAASQYNLGGYSDGGRLLRGPGDGVSDSIPATIGDKQPARLADGEFVVPARIVSELGNGSTEAGARKLYAMMDRVQKARGKTTGKNRVAANTRADKYLPA